MRAVTTMMILVNRAQSVSIFTSLMSSSVRDLSSLIPLFRGSDSRISRLRVVTDIDDTVKSSGGVRIFGIPLGGIDTRYKRGEFYPGAFQFAFEISANSDSGETELAPASVAVLTARARELKFALALKPGDKICTAYKQTGMINGAPNWGIDEVYYGSVAEWIFQERKGDRKFKNFELLLRSDEMKGRKNDYVLIGDTGEKDEEAGERIAKAYPNRVKAVFLHAVSSDNRGGNFVLPPDRVYNGVPFYYFRTYVGAAKKALNKRLISASGAGRIVDQARSEFNARADRLKRASSLREKPIVEEKLIKSQLKELEQDIERINEFMLKRNVGVDVERMFDILSSWSSK